MIQALTQSQHLWDPWQLAIQPVQPGDDGKLHRELDGRAPESDPAFRQMTVVLYVHRAFFGLFFLSQGRYRLLKPPQLTR